MDLIYKKVNYWSVHFLKFYVLLINIHVCAFFEIRRLLLKITNV